jgi:hypothetical protein
MLVPPALGKLRQEDCKFKASLSYKVRPVTNKQINKQTTNNKEQKSEALGDNI